MWPNPQFSADLVTFTEGIFNGKLHFLCSAKIINNRLTFVSTDNVKCEKQVLRKKRCSYKFRKIHRSHSLCQSLFFTKVAVLRAATLLKNRLWQRWFRLNFAKFLRTPFPQNTSERLLLKEQHPSLQIYLPIKKLNMTNNNQWNWKTCNGIGRRRRTEAWGRQLY